MAASFILIHSPSVGPRSWQPVAHRLTELGWEATVPPLLSVAHQGPPFWPRVVDAVRAGLGTAEQGQGVVLVAHSNAGLFLPVITAALPGQVRGCIFVDAALPPAAGATPVAPPELLALLRDKASGGLLPRWTDWWDEEEVAPLFPDQAIRQAVTAEQPRLPLSYYEASVPVPAGWDAQPCAYLLFGLPYDELASEARGRGWVVEQLPGRHLHQLVDPDGVARVAAGDHRADGDHHAYPSRVVHLVGPVWYTGSSGLRGRNQADTERMASPVQRHGPTLDSHDHRRA